MVDPGTALGIASLGLEVSKIILKLCNDFAGANRETTILRECNDDFAKVLERLRYLVDTHTTISQDDEDLINGLIARAKRVLTDVHRDLEKYRDKGGTGLNIRGRSRWVIRKDDVLDLIRRLESIKMTLNTMIQLIH